MKCEKCNKQVNILLIVPRELEDLFKFKKICMSCDTKLREEHINKIRLMYALRNYRWSL